MSLIYSMLMSVDGYVEDEHGRFDWTAPDEEVHSYINQLESSVGTYLYGRRMYETMIYWETAHSVPDAPDDPSFRTFGGRQSERGILGARRVHLESGRHRPTRSKCAKQRGSRRT
jgi:hypothetical protein